MTRAIACTVEQAELGEGARWDDRRGELLRVDIVAGRVFRERVAADGAHERVREYAVPGTVGAIAPIAGGQGWLLASGRGFSHLLPDGTHRRVVDVAPPRSRMNDAACDALGRCWAGSLADDHHAGGGAFYRLERDGTVDVVLEGLTIPNGMGWSPDGRTMYLIDSVPGVVLAFDFDLERGTLADRRVLIEIDDADVAPDGMTVDASGDLWIAIYNGGQVRRYSPEGELRDRHEVPARQVTSCAFGGDGMSTLYVTTATENWSAEERLAEPAAGLVYRFATDTTGLPARHFRPDPGWWARVNAEGGGDEAVTQQAHNGA